GVRVALIEGGRFWKPLDDAFYVTDAAIQERKTQALVANKPEPSTEQVRAELRAENVRQWWAARWWTDLIGIGVAILAVYIAGRLVGGFLGRRFYRRIEEVITALPVFKQVYPYIKQIVDFLFSDDKPIEFNRVVVTEYPRKGIWSVGFLTGGTMKAIAAHAGDSVTVFIPSSPTPFTGYTITVPRSEVIEVPITVEEAIRFAVSGGVLVPDHQMIRTTPVPPPGSTSSMLPVGASEAKDSDGDAPAPSRRRGRRSQRDAG
ncbi:MAG: DUF502 domain-containing protein, partial [Phycisphaerales bacterium]|nr:DUF502 domain-containing protein [Phycisphaerales bacterium]